jgi:DNA-binding MarR family transcriptional regulator
LSVNAVQNNGEGRSFLEDLSLELTSLAVSVAHQAERDRARRTEGARAFAASARQVRAVIAARVARAEAVGVDLANPGWSLMLVLLLAELEGRRVRLSRLAEEARVAATTGLRWIEVLGEAGLIVREPDDKRGGSYLLGLSAAGAGAMRDYFRAVHAGFIEG